MKILIVDDISENIQLAATILAHEGYQVEFATNGLDALEWIFNENFDLVLLDVMMPGMDGFEVCKRVRENQNYKFLPIIFISAATDKDSAIKGLKLGAQDFATKPFNAGELLSRIEIHIELSTARIKLEHMNAMLEEKVKERTNELEIVITELNIAKDKSEESNKLKSAFLANISHEIRTPLNGILGLSHLISDGSISDDEKNEYFGLLSESSKRLINLIDNLIDIAMLDTGQMIIEKRKFNLNALISSFYSIYIDKTLSKEIQLKLNLGANDEDSSLISDEIRLQQIFINLLDNALKFTESGKIDFGYEINGNDYLFFIKDTGIGISEDALPYIFDRFRQEEINLKRSYDGAGIGLSLVKGLLELLDGKIWVTSEKGKGSEFYFTLPKSRA